MPAGTLVPVAPTLSDCDAASVVVGAVSYRRCRRARIQVSSTQLGAAAQFAIAHVQPTPLVCRTPSARRFTVVRQPSAQSVAPTSICLGSSGSQLVVTGSFDVVDGLPPFLEIQGVAFPNRTASGCGAPNSVVSAPLCFLLNPTRNAARAGRRSMHDDHWRRDARYDATLRRRRAPRV